MQKNKQKRQTKKSKVENAGKEVQKDNNKTHIPKKIKKRVSGM